MEEYGSSNLKGTKIKKPPAFGHHIIPVMAATNATDFKQRNRNKTKENAFLYPSISGANSIDQSKDRISLGQSGVPPMQSGRNHQADEFAKYGNTNRSNFFPSFDSRGNIGIIEDSNEFTPIKKRLKSNLNATRTSMEERERNQAPISARRDDASMHVSRKSSGLPSL